MPKWRKGASANTCGTRGRFFCFSRFAVKQKNRPHSAQQQSPQCHTERKFFAGDLVYDMDFSLIFASGKTRFLIGKQRVEILDWFDFSLILLRGLLMMNNFAAVIHFSFKTNQTILIMKTRLMMVFMALAAATMTAHAIDVTPDSRNVTQNFDGMYDSDAGAATLALPEHRPADERSAHRGRVGRRSHHRDV